jgi:hypothetical protein
VEGLIDWEIHEQIRAEQIVNALVIGEYATVRENFNSAMKSSLSLRRLRSAWEGVIKEAGEFVGIIKIENLPHEEFEIYLATTHHEHAGVVIRTVFDGEGFLTGLHFRYTELDIHESGEQPNTGISLP